MTTLLCDCPACRKEGAEPFDLRVMSPAEARRHIGDRDVVDSVSGGKDSAATALLLRELDIPTQHVHSATGWESALTDDYLEGELTRVLGPITVLRANVPILAGYEADVAELELMLDPHFADKGRSAPKPSPMVRLCLWKGCFPGQDTRWCTSALKVETFALAMETAEELVNVVGIRRGESKNRNHAAEWETLQECKLTNFTGVRMSRKKGVPIDPDAPGRTIRMDHIEQWRPIVNWTVEEVVAIHKRHGLAMNPLYRLGTTRVGCWPCIYQRKEDIRLMADLDPERIRVIERLEMLVGVRAKARRESRENRRILSPPSWFQIRDATSLAKLLSEFPAMAHDLMYGHKGGRRKPTGKIIPGEVHSCVPIADVVEWSRTGRGGKQVELFGPPSRDWACSKFGYCETRPAEGDAVDTLPAAAE